MIETASNQPLSPAALRSQPLTGYLLALGIILITFFIRLALAPILHNNFPLATMFLGMVLVAARIGKGPAILAAVLGYLLAEYFFMGRPGLYPDTLSGVIGDIIYVTNCTIVISFAEAQRVATRRAQNHSKDLEREAEVRKRTEAALRQSNTEIEALNRRLRRAMRETHHRVKNNLQVVAALADIQRDAATDGTVPTAALDRIGQHVRNLAAIHDILTSSVRTNPDVATIETQTILGRLIPLMQTTSGARPIRQETAPLLLPLNQGASLSLLVSELVSNAVKHGRGDIAICLAATDGMARLEVTDDGPGFPSGFDPQMASNTGLDLIETLVRHDLRGEVVFRNRPEGGGSVVVTFPIHISDDPDDGEAGHISAATARLDPSLAIPKN